MEVFMGRKALSVAAVTGPAEGLLGSGGQWYRGRNLPLVGARCTLGTRGLCLAGNSSGLLQVGRKEERIVTLNQLMNMLIILNSHGDW